MFFRETHGNWSRLALICNKLLEGLAALIGRGERGEGRESAVERVVDEFLQNGGTAELEQSWQK